MFPAFGREIRLGLMYTGGKAIWSFCWSEGMNSAGIVVSSAGVTAVVESGWLESKRFAAWSRLPVVSEVYSYFYCIQCR